MVRFLLPSAWGRVRGRGCCSGVFHTEIGNEFTFLGASMTFIIFCFSYVCMSQDLYLSCEIRGTTNASLSFSKQQKMANDIFNVNCQNLQ